MNEQIQKISVKGLVCRADAVFMLRDQKGNWELPGGRIDFGETPEEALRREFKEELAVDDLHIKDLLDAWCFQTTARGDDYHFTILVYCCVADLSHFVLSDEHTEQAWVPFGRLSEYPMREGYVRTIEDFIASRQGEAIDKSQKKDRLITKYY